MWAAQALKFGYRWVVGDGTKVRFWKDTWFGTAPLATQFWDLFCICNQTGVPLASVWNGVEVKLTFRRNFSEEMMERWYELTEIISSVVYNNDGDALVWQYESNEEYSTQSLYDIVDFIGVIPAFIPTVREIRSPQS